MIVKKYEEGIKLDGYISSMPESIYHNTDGFISKSSLTAMGKSPLSFFSGVKMKQTKAMEIGTAIHCAILEPLKFNSSYKLMPDCNDRRLKEYKDAIKEAELNGFNVLTGVDAENVIGMIKAIKGNSAATELLDLDGLSEVSGFHVDEFSGVSLRHRFDRLTRCGIAIDLKKTQSVNRDELSKTISKYGYHIQAALYSDAYKAITGENLERFYFIFVEESFPHEVAVVFLDDISMQVGRDEYQSLLMQYCYYLDNPEQLKNNALIEMISLPEYKLRDYESDLEDGGIY